LVAEMPEIASKEKEIKGEGADSNSRT